jgi:hypothetical protein
MAGTPTATGVIYSHGVYFNWGSNPPRDSSGVTIPDIPADNFSAVFTSTQQFNKVGIYNFTIFGNDGIRIYLNGELYLDQLTPFNNPNPNAYQTFTFEYQNTVASAVEMRVEYVEYLHDANLVVQWGEPRSIGFNLLENSSFEQASTSAATPAHWTVNGLKNDKRLCKANAPFVAYQGFCAYQFKASAINGRSATRTLEQMIEPAAFADISAGDALVFNARVKPKALSGTKTQAFVVLMYDDGPLAGERRKKVMRLPTGTTPYQYFIFEAFPSLAGKIRWLKTGIRFQNSTGVMHVDSFELGWVIGGTQALRNDIPPLLELPLTLPPAP